MSLTRICSGCQKVLTYASKDTLQKANKKGGVCHKCNSKSRIGKPGKKHTEESRAKLRGPRYSIRGENNPFKKSLDTPEKRIGHSERCKEIWRKRTPEQRNKATRKRLTGFGNVSGSFWATIKSNAKVRNLELNITPEYIWGLFIKQNELCALTGIKLILSPFKRDGTTASLDRIDSSKGYVEGNVRWVHKTINIMRMALTDLEFIKFCELIYKKSIHRDIICY